QPLTQPRSFLRPRSHASSPACGTISAASRPNTSIYGTSASRIGRVAQRGVVAQFGGRAGMADAAFFQDVDAVGEGQREVDPLLGQQDRDAFVLQRADIVEQRLDDER